MSDSGSSSSGRDSPDTEYTTAGSDDEFPYEQLSPPQPSTPTRQRTDSVYYTPRTSPLPRVTPESVYRRGGRPSETSQSQSTFYTSGRTSPLQTQQSQSTFYAPIGSPYRTSQTASQVDPFNVLDRPVSSPIQPPESPFRQRSTGGVRRQLFDTQQTEQSVRPKVRSPQGTDDPFNVLDRPIASTSGSSYVPQSPFRSRSGTVTVRPQPRQSEQQEPSVRPKVRLAQNIPPMPRFQPGPEERTPELVRKYRNPTTRSPNWDAMREDSYSVGGQFYSDPSDIGSEVSSRYQARARALQHEMSGRTGRQKKILQNRGYEYDPFNKRWLSNESILSKPGSSTSGSGADMQSLLPIRSRPRLASRSGSQEFEVQRNIQGMGSPSRSTLMPTGRMGYGTQWDPSRRRSYSMDDLTSIVGVTEDQASRFTPREQEFSQRLRHLPASDMRSYQDFRDSADPRRQWASRRRMIKHSRIGLLDKDKSRVSKIRSQSASGLGDRDFAMRQKLRERDRVLPSTSQSSLDEETQPLLPVGEKWKREKDWKARQKEYKKLFQDISHRQQRQPGLHGQYESGWRSGSEDSQSGLLGDNRPKKKKGFKAMKNRVKDCDIM